jgi:hypothetical protein
MMMIAARYMSHADMACLRYKILNKPLQILRVWKYVVVVQCAAATALTTSARARAAMSAKGVDTPSFYVRLMFPLYKHRTS